MRCYSDYMHDEYGDVDSDYVFVNLWSWPARRADHLRGGAQAGRSASASRTGVEFTLHMLRHTHATALIRSGVAIEVVARLLTHRSSTTTSQIYVHLDAADVRDALAARRRVGRAEEQPDDRSRQPLGTCRAGRGSSPVPAMVEAEFAKDRWDALVLGVPARRGRNTARFAIDRPALAAGGDQAVVPVPARRRLRFTTIDAARSGLGSILAVPTGRPRSPPPSA